MTNPTHTSLGHSSFAEPGRRGRSRRGGSLPWLGGLSLAAAVPVLGWTAPSQAGVVLVSRQSYIRATGGPGPNGFDLSDGTTDFGRFANDLTNAPSDDPSNGTMPLVSEAHQYSVPGLTDKVFQGAYAEGSVRAGVHAPNSIAAATSDFDLTFRVTGGNADYTFGAAMGTAGSGTVMAELLNLTPTASPAAAATGGRLAAASATPSPIFSSKLTPITDHANTFDQQGVLAPGLYTLHIHAGSDDAAVSADDSSAYYNMSLTLTGNSTPATAVPLPTAAWTGLTGLGGLAAVQFARRRRRAA